ncbi:DDE-type integrase/transposase/recombinase [Methanobrevibacter gottschalkii]|uniref:DDE-type integrase/transposase/recombinase n=1 Tax=Methanobrevibacter gottschalkii TaxID=190974 RepID=UPI0038D008BB
MISLTSRAHFRQRVIRYSEKKGVTKAADRFRVSRKAIYEWKKKYDGTWKSLMDKSHRPHHHPAEHTQEEYDLIRKYWEKNQDDRIVLWQKIRDKGYARSYKSMCRAIRRMQLGSTEKPRKGYKPKPYEQMTYPGQKVQIDVKYVPTYCVAGETKYYQYTAIDEYTRLVYREMYDEHSTYSSRDFIQKVVKFFPFKIELVQTDNGTEWTNALISNTPTPTLFEAELEKLGIRYTRIRIATPRHNGKVERQHRTDEKRFYKKMRMYSLEDGRKQLAKYNRKSNNIVKICLDFKSPNEKLQEYFAQPSANLDSFAC